MSPEPTIRAAVPADLPALHALVERAYRGDEARRGWSHEADLIQGPRTSQAELAAIVADPSQRLFVSETDGALVGCVSIAKKDAATAYLGLLTVDPVRQAAGLGRIQLAEGERRAVAEFGSSRIEMTVVSQRAELIAYYERRGYRATGERRPFVVPLDPPLEFIVLEKRL